jgi:signal transduction histidine kinase
MYQSHRGERTVSSGMHETLESLREELDTERAAHAEAVRLSQLKDAFLARLSHDLRTPMSAVLGWAKALQLKRADPATLERGLDAISRNAVAQARLIDELLEMNRLASGKVSLEVRPLDIASVIAAAVEGVRPLADAKDLRLTQALDPLAGSVSSDPGRQQQEAISNLLSNAVGFTPRGGQIEVLLRQAGNHLELTVRDDGIGNAGVSLIVRLPLSGQGPASP